MKLGVLASAAGVVGIAIGVVVLGTDLAGGDPEPDSPTPPPWLSTPPPWMTPPLPDFSKLPPPPPEPTSTPQPSSITIRGIQVPLAPGMRYQVFSRSPVPGTFRTATYSQADGQSRLDLDQDDRVAYAYILPEHLALFQPLLDAALPRLAPKVTIYGQEVQLAPGMTYREWTVPNFGVQLWSVEYISIPANAQVSWVTVEMSTGRVVRSHINPEDEALFQPVLDLIASAAR